MDSHLLGENILIWGAATARVSLALMLHLDADFQSMSEKQAT